jgi:hypothetical protein
MSDLSTGAPAETSTAPAPGSTSTTSTAAPPDTSTTTTAAAPPPAKKFEYTEDRTDWVPRHRLGEVSTRAQRLEAELALERRRIQALTGVTPADPQAGERAELAKALGEIHPALGKIMSLDEAKLTQLLGFIDHIPAVTATIDQYWNRNTQTTLDAVVTAFEGKGVKISLDDADDAEVVRGALVNWVRADRTGKRESRFEGNDPKLLDEFVGYFYGRFGAPGQVTATTSTARETDTIRRTLPKVGAKTTVVPTTDASTASTKPGEGGMKDRRDLHSRARQSYLDRVGARS